MMSCAAAATSHAQDLQDKIFCGSSQPNGSIILPRALKKNSVIAITSPASPTSMGEIARCMKMLKSYGYSIVVGDTIRKQENRYRYLSASDESRSSEFMEFITDRKIDCILCARGGYGVMRILGMLDYDAIRNNPKIIIGFSDITALINSIFAISSLVTFHGPVATKTFDSVTTQNLFNLIAPSKSGPLTLSFQGASTLVKGSASGRLVGGNLTMLTSTLGSPFETDTKDSILFIEEVSEHPYKIDRMLSHLKISGKLESLKGIIVGSFDNPNRRKPFFPNVSYSIAEVFEQILGAYGVPFIFGAPIGHNKSQFTIPIGVTAELNATDKKLVILEPAVKI